MNCPKYVAAAISYQGYIGDIDVTCDREQCALWDKMKHQCVVRNLDDNLADLWRAEDNLARSINQAVLRK